MNIIEAIKDDNLFRNFMDSNSLASWLPWMTALRVLYGLPIHMQRNRDLIHSCTGRDSHKLPAEGFETALFLTGRRSGKSRIAAVIGAFEACLAGHEQKLAKGERGVVAICSPTKSQSTTCRNYLKAVFDTTPILANEVTHATREGFDLKNGISIRILAGDFRSVRGYTLVAALVDELAFFGLDAESKVKSDSELIRALQPGLATIGGKLIGISSPYARRGYCFNQHKRNFGNDNGSTLVWNCSSRTMNPTLRQLIIDRAMQDDAAAARSEYLGQFRDDIAAFIPREVIEQLVISGRKELLPQRDRTYFAFADLSGGRSDAAALAIGHKQNGKCVIDVLRTFKPPFNPTDICRVMADVAKKYRVLRVIGDNYAAEFTKQAFESCGMHYVKSSKNKSQLYVELLPVLCSRGIELLDETILVDQLAALERRTRSGGKDVIDHAHGQHDDDANVIAGVCDVVLRRRKVAGVLC